MPETLTACPICQSASIFKRRDEGYLAGVYTCKACGQYFVNPRMTDEEVSAYYQGAYWNAMSKNNEGLSMNNLVRHRDRARTQVITLADWLKDLHTVLEIGSSAGYLLDYLHSSYEMDTMGVEPDTRHHAVAPAKYHKLVTDVSLLPARRFDLIALSHSLEHLNHPLEFMRDLTAKHAHPGTRIMIEVPNLDHGHPTTLSDRHPFGFNVKTLTQLMGRIGYKPMVTTFHGLNSLQPLYLLGMFERSN